MSKPEFVYTTYIETSAEKLWHALTDGDFTERYWFGHRVTSDWKVGSPYRFTHPERPSPKGKVLDIGSAEEARLYLGCLLRRVEARTNLARDLRSRAARQYRQIDGHA